MRAKKPTPERELPNRKAESATGETISNSVRSAYEVIDRYMSEGQNIAQELSKSYSKLAMEAVPNEWQALQSNWLRASSDLMAGWMDMVGSTSERYNDAFSQQMASNSATTFSSASPTFTITSAKKTTATGRLSPGATRFEIKSGNLTNGSHTIAFQAVGSPDTGVTIEVDVPARQAGGTYAANLVNAVTGEILGDISLDIA
ncbi:MAG: hypothetical protein GKR90_15655 [Pseudomonadales bacterium]|nr:hypothetical protein [Pseudomonadales bacterium]